MQGLIFTAEQAKLVVDGELDVVQYPISQHVLPSDDFLARTARFVHVGAGSRYWAALDATGQLCGTVCATVVNGELVYLAEPWVLRPGDPCGVHYEADATSPGCFFAPAALMPWNASRRRLLVLEVEPTQLIDPTSSSATWHWHIKFAPYHQPHQEKKKHHG